jgi:NAD(P)-dependent dehydrogenase (short-subunit alcohol dehydrogenase family)
MRGLRRQTALVTAASMGIGAAIAAALASLGGGEVHDQTKFGVQAAVRAAFVNWFRCWSSWRQACASSLR